MDRKEFFTYSWNLLLQKGIQILEKTEIVKKLEKPVLRPPGASADFLAKCTGCDACMAACPINIILIHDLERRDPFIEKGTCIHCPGYPCIASCPTGALKFNR